MPQFHARHTQPPRRDTYLRAVRLGRAHLDTIMALVDATEPQDKRARTRAITAMSQLFRALWRRNAGIE